MDAEIEADKRGKPQRWESKELHNNMKNIRIHQLLEQKRGKDRDIVDTAKTIRNNWSS